MTDRVLVTGASGFIAKHIVLSLVRNGWRVRGTVRSAAKATEIQAILQREGCDDGLFEPVELDLSRDDGWPLAAEGCRYLLHTASPFPLRQPKGKFELVAPARDGTLRALRAAKAAGCEHVVLTSSVAAMFYGYPSSDTRVFGEGDFSRIESDAISPYAVSKTVAEEAAWAYAREAELPLSTINPALVFGPLLDGVLGTSARLVGWMARGRLPVVPDITFGIADVRDVARAHIEAMTRPETVGRRFVVSGGERDLVSIAAAARASASRQRGMRPVRVPSWLIRTGGRLSPSLAMLSAELDRIKRLDTRPLQDILSIRPSAPEVAIRDLVGSIERYDAR